MLKFWKRHFRIYASKALQMHRFLTLVIISWKGRQDRSASQMDYAVGKVQVYEHELLFSYKSKGDES